MARIEFPVRSEDEGGFEGLRFSKTDSVSLNINETSTQEEVIFDVDFKKDGKVYWQVANISKDKAREIADALYEAVGDGEKQSEPRLVEQGDVIIVADDPERIFVTRSGSTAHVGGTAVAMTIASGVVLVDGDVVEVLKSRG